MRYIKYTTKSGDMFDHLALDAYGEETMAGHIIEANPDYADTLIFPAGMELKIPMVDHVITPESLPPWRKL